MAVMRCYFFSQVLKQHTTLTVAMPDRVAPGKTWPLLFLLHGGTEDSTIWFRHVDVESIANKYGLVAVSLDALSSSYTNMRHGGRYFTYLTEELPAWLAARLPVTARPQDTYISGFSMGGGGALKTAFRRPDLYAASIAISGARDTIPLFEKWSKMEGGPDLQGVVDALGPIEDMRGGEDDLVYLAQRAAQTGDYPPLYLSCAHDDYAQPLSEDYHRQLVALGVKHDYYTAPGIHNYVFGQQALCHALDCIWKERGQA